MKLPPDHPLRTELNDEVHARPPDALAAPVRVSYLALFSDGADRGREWEAVRDVADRFGAPPPAPGAVHYAADFGAFHLTWERHTEFVRFSFAFPGAAADPFDGSGMEAVPPDWLASLPGRVLVAARVALLPAADAPRATRDIQARLFADNPLVGATIAGGAGTALTDFRIHPDGQGRLLVLDRGMPALQAGRMVQRLLEMDTYRVLALLALPVARDLTPHLAASELELARTTAALATAEPADEPALLDRLTRIAAGLESRQADNVFRFGAAAAYGELVQRRVMELREARIQGLQTFREFTERRLVPALNTCRAVAARQESLSRRVARATALLSTRVEITSELQTRAVLESMNRRAKLQLRLQRTVEGLSVAAVTYYVVGLVGYAAKGLLASGVRVSPDLATGISLPLVAAATALGVRRVRAMFASRGS